MLIEWCPEMSVGVDLLDEEHKKIISTLNDLNDAVVSNNVRLGLKKYLEEMIKCCEEHFIHEEALFLGVDYPGKERHIEEHRKTREYLLDARIKFERGELDNLSPKMMEFLKWWLLNHIQETDMRYVPYLHQPKT